MINNQEQETQAVEIDSIETTPKPKRERHKRNPLFENIKITNDPEPVKRCLDKFGIPVKERIYQLNAIGLKVSVIVSAINNEFKEILNEPIGPASVITILKSLDAQKVKENITASTRNDLASHSAILFKKVAKAEEAIVSTYSTKLIEALTLLETIDIAELDDKSQLVNLKKIIDITDVIEKYHSKASKVIGTEALREIETFRAKAQIKQQQENATAHLVPMPANNSNRPTRFL